MSFGDGNLHEMCERYRRQLGAAQARERRLKAEVRERDGEAAALRQAMGKMLAEFGECARDAGGEWPERHATWETVCGFAGVAGR